MTAPQIPNEIPDDPSADRQKYLGGSDAAAILGASPWRTPLTVWAEKTGRYKSKPPPDLIEWGERLEPEICRKFQDRHPELDVVDPVALGIGYVGGHPDMLLSEGHYIVGALEAKNVNIYSDDFSGRDPVAPLKYQIQLQHYLHLIASGMADGVAIHPDVTAGRRSPVGWFAVLRGGHQYVEVPCVYHEPFGRELMRRLDRFWKYVVDDEPPVGMLMAPDSAVVEHIVNYREAAERNLGENGAALHAMRERIKGQIDILEEKKQIVEAGIKALIGDASVGWLPGGKKYTHRLEERPETIVKRKAFSKRVLRAPRRRKLTLGKAADETKAAIKAWTERD